MAISLCVGGTDPWEPTDPTTARRFASGSLVLQREGAFYEKPDSEGSRKLVLYPAPGEGLTIDLEWVYRPDVILIDEEPNELPEEFHPALIPELAATYYELVEDNPELAQRNAEKADLWVGELNRYDNQRRGGNDPFMVPILGISA
jgi:hypothetical protein